MVGGRNLPSMGTVGRLRRRWLSLGIDVRVLISITVGAIVADVLAWGEGIRNGHGPSVSIGATVLMAALLSYTWWRMYHELRGPGFTKNKPSASTRSGPDQSNCADGPRP